MIKMIACTFLGVCLSLSTTSPCIGAEGALRAELEKAWMQYIEASTSGEESELQATMSSFRLGMMKNNLASAKQKLTPDIIKSIAEYMPDISTAQFVTLLRKGDTAGLVYVKDSEERDATDKPRVSFIFIKFVNEAAGWKVDAGMDIGSPKFQDDGKKSKFDPSDLPATYEIDGKVRPAPTPIKQPYASAFLDVFCPGYELSVTVNGVEQTKTVDKSHSGLLQGGLSKGDNTIVIDISQIKDEAVFEPRVTVRRILDTRKMEEVFTFEPKEDIEGKHSLAFTIDE